MKKQVERIIAVMVCLVLLVGMIPLTAVASTVTAEGTCGDSVTWKLESDGTFTMSGEGPMYTYYFDWDEYYEPLVPWCAYRSSITKVIIEDGVTNISQYSFYGCTNLTEIVIGNDVETIGYMAFNASTNVREITMGSSVKQIAESAFNTVHLEKVHISDIAAWCEIEFNSRPMDWSGFYDEVPMLYMDGVEVTDLVIPEGVTSISAFAFSNCHLTSVELPDTLTSIGHYAFSNCDLTSIEFPEGLTNIGYDAFEGCNFSSLEFPDGLETIGSHAFAGSTFTTVEIPESVTQLSGAFSGCTGLTSITIPDQIQDLGAYTFANCANLTTVVLPEGLTSIGDYAFSNCSALTEFAVPENVTSIGDYCFQNCTGLETVSMSDLVTEIGAYAFQECTGLKEITLSNQLGSIGSYAFYNCTALESIAIPGSVTLIGGYAFRGCTGLESLTISQGTTDMEIDGGAFWGCSNLPSIELPDNVAKIGSYAFLACSAAATLTLPASISAISSKTFSGCSAVESVTIPANVTAIESEAFANCTSLTYIEFLGDAPSIDSAAFTNVVATCYYPEGNETYTAEVTTEDYGGDLIWTYEGEEEDEAASWCGENITWELTEDGTLILTGTGSIYDYAISDAVYAPWYEVRNSILSIEIGDGITSIGDAAFYSCSAATSVTMSDSVTSIGDKAFYGIGATSIELSAGLKEIGSYAFATAKLTSVTLPEGVETVGEAAFYNSKLKNVVLPDSLTYIPNNMFQNCYYLATVDLPVMITTIGDYAFSACYGLNSLVLPEGLVSIGTRAFALCGGYTTMGAYYSASSFKSVTLPSTLQTIGPYAFTNCEVLSSIVIPDGVRIEEGAFRYCYKLTQATFSANVEYIGTDAFLQCKKLTKITFEWNVPEIGSYPFSSVTAKCYYPSNNPDWTDEVLQQKWGGSLTWVAEEMEEPELPGEEENPDSPNDGEETDSDEEDSTGDNTEDGSTEGGGTEDGSTEGGGTEDGSTEGGGTEGGSTSGDSSGDADYQCGIVTHPLDQNVSLGADAVFTVEAVGDGLTYQWQYSNNGGTYWYDSGMEGSTTSELTVTAVAKRDGQMYRCVVQDQYGTKEISNYASLIIYTGIEITSQPESQSVALGENAVFTVTAAGEDLSYQWQYSNSGGTYWFDSSMTGYNTNELTVEAISKRNGQMYRCVISGSDGNQVTSEAATLSVETTEAVEITVQPVSQAVALGENAVFTVTATGEDLSYQWQYSNSGGIYWHNSGMTGYNTNELTVETAAKRDGQMYRCVITDSNGNQVTSETAVLSIEDTVKIEITAQPESQTVALGENAVFTVIAAGENLSYQWQYSNNGGTYWFNSGMIGYNTNELTVEAATKRDGQMYRCVITDRNGNQVMTVEVILSISG